MRPRIESGRKAVSVPLSLYPEQKKFLTKRSLALSISASRYVQRLIEYDRTNNVVAKTISEEAQAV